MKPLVFVALATLLLATAPESRAETSRPTCDAPALAHNERLGRTVLEEVLGKGRIAENEHIYHRDFVAHGGERDYSRGEDRAATEGWHKAVPDIQVSALRIVADCRRVVVHFEARGTNTGEGNGLPATGRAVRMQGITIFGIRDGQIAEEWTIVDQYGMLKQLGLLP
jgi:steroid delta-isomerase-like uncharacterized protein